LKLFAAGTKAQQKISAQLVVLVCRDLIGELFVEAEDTFCVRVSLWNWLVVLFVDVGSNLKVRATARVIDRTFLNGLVGYGIGDD